MSDRSQFSNGHFATLHAFLLAAKEMGHTEFRLQTSVGIAKGKLEISIHTQAQSGMSAKFDVRGNMVRPLVPVDRAEPLPNERTPTRIARL